MRAVYELLVTISILAFFFYGLSVLFRDAMVEEFERYGLSRYRRLTGLLEVLGALGLLLGHVVPGLTVLAGGGLALLMAMGVVVRVWSGDSAAQTFQAFTMMLINLFIVIYAIRFAGR